MRTIVALCLVALAMGQPLKEEVKGSADHIQKREVAINGESEEIDCSQLSGHALAVCNEKRVKREAEMAKQSDSGQRVKREAEMAEQSDGGQRVKRDAVMVEQSDGGQDVNGTAHQDNKVQEAWSKEGAYARQGEGGQFVSASDFGGPIVQILQHVYKANCCSCGCNCGCPGGDGPSDNGSDEGDTTTGQR